MTGEIPLFALCRCGVRPWRLPLLLLWLGLSVVPSALAETFYTYRDARGVIHLSNRKCDARYRPFAAVAGPTGARQAQVLPFIRYYCRRFGLDPALVRAMVAVESDFMPRAVSPRGAAGLLQIMPGTGKHLGLADPFDGADNLEAGIRYLRTLLDTYGDVRLALAAYNAGPGRVPQGGPVPDIPETRAYVARVMALAGLR